LQPGGHRFDPGPLHSSQDRMASKAKAPWVHHGAFEFLQQSLLNSL